MLAQRPGCSPRPLTTSVLPPPRSNTTQGCDARPHPDRAPPSGRPDRLASPVSTRTRSPHRSPIATATQPRWSHCATQPSPRSRAAKRRATGHGERTPPQARLPSRRPPRPRDRYGRTSSESACLPARATLASSAPAPERNPRPGGGSSWSQFNCTDTHSSVGSHNRNPRCRSIERVAGVRRDRLFAVYGSSATGISWPSSSVGPIGIVSRPSP